MADDADGEFILTFPMYALLLKDASGTIFLRHGVDLFLPLFTDADSAITYLERSGIKECVVQELPTPAALGAFLRHPPSRTGLNDVGWVIFDPIDNSPRPLAAYTREQLLASLPGR